MILCVICNAVYQTTDQYLVNDSCGKSERLEEQIGNRILELRKLVIEDDNPLHKCEYNYAILELMKLIENDKK